MRELITLQLGGYANHVGAHYWNFQDELLGLAAAAAANAAAGGHGEGATVNPLTGAGGALSAPVDELLTADRYREGVTDAGEPTHTPRALIFDLCGTLGAVAAAGAFYRDDTAAVLAPACSSGVIDTWDSRTTVIQKPRVAKTAYQALLEEEEEEEGGGYGAEGAVEGMKIDGEEDPEEVDPDKIEDLGEDPARTAARALDVDGGVRYWTDYCKVVFHRKTTCLLPGAWQGADDLDGFGSACDLSARAEYIEESMDRLRFFAEECDRLAGFQCFVDDTGGFGGIAASVLQEVADDYTGASRILFSTRPPALLERLDAERTTAVQRLRQLSEGFSLTQLAPLAGIMVPCSIPIDSKAFPFLAYHHDWTFHSSAVLAAAIDTAMLPVHLRPAPTALGPSRGDLDMLSLINLLARSEGANVSALSAVFPAFTPPHDAHAAAKAEDERMRRRASSDDDDDRPCPWTRRGLTSLTPGIEAGPIGLRAESVVLRGARTEGEPLRAEAAAAALDASLVREKVRCVQHRCIASQPLAVPLPFPAIFSPRTSVHGDLRSPPRPGQRVKGVSMPMLTRLVAPDYEEAAAKVLAQFKQNARSMGGSNVLETWGYGDAERAELVESLTAITKAYRDDEGLSSDMDSDDLE